MNPTIATITNYFCLVCSKSYATAYLARRCCNCEQVIVAVVYGCGWCEKQFTTEIDALQCCKEVAAQWHRRKRKSWKTILNAILAALLIGLVFMLLLMAQFYIAAR